MLRLNPCYSCKWHLYGFATWAASISQIVLLLVPTPAQAEAAFAWSRDRGGRYWYGSATNLTSKYEATQLAIQRCAQGGPGCQVERQFHMGCFAFAASPHGAIGMAMGPSESHAKERALRICAQYRGIGCVAQHVFCDNVSENIVTILRQGETERALLLRRHLRTTACNISGKALSYSTEHCDGRSGCQQVRNYIEIVGDKVLLHVGNQPGKGIVYELGKTIPAVDEAGVLNMPTTTNRLHSRGNLATASFDGVDLVLRLDQFAYARLHESHPDDTMHIVAVTWERIRFTQCTACLLQEQGIQIHDLDKSEPPTISRNKECQMASMK